MERNQARQWNNRHVARKGKENLSQFIDNMILYKENAKESTERLLELRNRFSKVAGYKVNTEILCCISTHQQGMIWKENEEKSPTYDNIKKKKIVGINLTKKCKTCIPKTTTQS